MERYVVTTRLKPGAAPAAEELLSAGPPFVLPGTTAPVAVPALIMHQGTATLSTRVPGITLNGPAGVEGKSIVLHASESGPLDAAPGVPNDRVACGVIGPIPTIF